MVISGVQGLESTLYADRMHPERQRGTPPGDRRGDGRRDAARADGAPTRPFVGRVASPVGLHAGRGRRRRRGRRARLVRARRCRHRSARPSRRASAPRRGRRRALRPDRRRDHGRLRRAGEEGRRRSRVAVPAAGLSLRRGVGESGAQEPRGHPARRVRRARGEDGDRRLEAGLRPGGSASERRRRGDRRAHAAHRLQHQPGHRSARRGEEDRRRDPPQQRRLPFTSSRWASRWKIAASCRSR